MKGRSVPKREISKRYSNYNSIIIVKNQEGNNMFINNANKTAHVGNKEKFGIGQESGIVC